ncbi:MAG: tRNA pseudouridine(13) synthase TruD, partial [Candidatus Geothermarchaeales archaeon]
FRWSLTRKRGPKKNFPVFWVKGRGIDAFGLMARVAQELRVSPRSVRLLGLKDARAEKAHLLALRTRHFLAPRERDFLTFLGWAPRLPNKRLLKGNRFGIVVRGVDADRRDGDAISRFLGEMHTRGIPNFFGYQRFGHPRRITHEVGEMIARSRFEDAVKHYLTYTDEREPESVRQWRMELGETWNYNRAYRESPTGATHERRMLERLVEKEDDFIAALRALPLSLRRLFLQACQSYLFNIVLSKRIESGRGIAHPNSGDLVYDHRRRKTGFYSAGSRHVTVMLPLVGYSGFPSKGEQRLLIEEVLSEHELNPRNFYVDAMPEGSCRGTLRTATQNVEELVLHSDFETRSITCMFTLAKGSYATVLLRELMKPKKPAEQGF